MRDRFSIIGIVIRIRKLSLLLVMMLRIPNTVRRCVEPPPGPPSRCCYLCPSKSCRLDMRGRRITGHSTSVGRRDVGPTAWSSGQRRSSLVLYVFVIDDPYKSATFWGRAGIRRQCFRLEWLHSHRPLPRHPIFSGRRGAVLFFLTAGVLRTPSSFALRWVHPCGMVHTRCQ